MAKKINSINSMKCQMKYIRYLKTSSQDVYVECIFRIEDNISVNMITDLVNKTPSGQIRQ